MKWYLIGGPAKIGYWGGKFDPNENDRIKGIVAAKSLHAFVAICIFPASSSPNVFVIKETEKKKKIKKRKISNFVILLKKAAIYEVYM